MINRTLKRHALPLPTTMLRIAGACGDRRHCWRRRKRDLRVALHKTSYRSSRAAVFHNSRCEVLMQRVQSNPKSAMSGAWRSRSTGRALTSTAAIRARARLWLCDGSRRKDGAPRSSGRLGLGAMVGSCLQALDRGQARHRHRRNRPGGSLVIEVTWTRCAGPAFL